MSLRDSGLNYSAGGVVHRLLLRSTAIRIEPLNHFTCPSSMFSIIIQVLQVLQVLRAIPASDTINDRTYVMLYQ